VPGGAALTVAARGTNALTLLLQHGILQPFYIPILADQMLTWGETSNQVLSRLGVSADRFTALGSPAHDTMFPSADNESKHRMLTFVGLSQRPTIVFFSNGNDLVRNGNAPAECARWLEEVAAEFDSQINVVVRLHPNEDGSLYDDCPNLHIVKNAPDIQTTLNGCDCAASLCSTVLYEALLYNKPVWQFHADDWPDLADNWRQHLAERIASKRQLIDAVRRLVSKEPPTFALSRPIDDVFLNHGHATQAIADFVELKLHEQNSS
jgi:hypothetical protein